MIPVARWLFPTMSFIGVGDATRAPRSAASKRRSRLREVILLGVFLDRIGHVGIHRLSGKHIMTADERLALVRLKIERADKHIDDLKAAVRSFFDTGPYLIGHKHDLHTRKLVYYVASVQPVPVAIVLILGDILHCLRDALDYLAQQLYLVGTGNANGYRDKTSFLIAKSAKDFKAGFAGKVEGMRKDAIDAIAALEPYPSGKGADLFTLHRLNNIDKHRLIVTVGSMYRSVDLGAHMTARMEKILGKTLPTLHAFLRPADNLFPLEEGKELLVMGVDDEPNEKMQFTFAVAIYEPGIIEGEPIVETIMTFRDRISDIVNAFKPCLS
jgi:hypothetical protein